MSHMSDGLFLWTGNLLGNFLLNPYTPHRTAHHKHGE